MDLLDVAILALRLALVLVLYLFLWLVVRSAWRALRSAHEPTLEAQPRRTSDAKPAPAVGARRRQPVDTRLRLLVLDAGDSDLVAGSVVELADGAVLGRAERASMVVSDPAVSAEHARVALLDGGWSVADLGSTNGTLVNQALVHGQAALEPGDVLGLGNVRLKVVGGEPRA